jgi:LmbE family N-acetylglucosaminyl deacetylase
MYPLTLIVLAALLVFTPARPAQQARTPKTLVAVLAHADDESFAAPALARYAREGVQVYLLIATDGGQGTGMAAARGETVQAGQDLARARAEEARCAADALGLKPPILLSFPDGKLGDYIGDRTLMYRLTEQIAGELQRLRPDAIVTWGPEGGTGHPDHRIVGNIVTQLQRAGVPGVPERIFHIFLPAEAMRAMNPQRGEPPMLVPDAKYATARVPFQPVDLQASARSAACHRSQISDEVAQRVQATATAFWNGAVAFFPAFQTGPVTDLFR